MIVRDDTEIRDVRYRGVAPVRDMYGHKVSFHVSAGMETDGRADIAILAKAGNATLPIATEHRLPIDELPSMAVDSKLALIIMGSESRTQGLEWLIEILAASVARLDVVAEPRHVRFRLAIGPFRTDVRVETDAVSTFLAVMPHAEISAA